MDIVCVVFFISISLGKPEISSIMRVNAVTLAKCGGFGVSLFVCLLKECVGEGGRKIANQRAHGQRTRK